MSAILGVFSTARAHERADVDAMLARMARRGADAAEAWESDGCTLGVARQVWELSRGLSGDALVVQDGDVAVAADAALYYVRDLRRRLADAGVVPSGGTPSHLIAAAYRAWGERCAERLEGDFAFVVWDAARRTAVCARDFGGKRPLHWAVLDGELVVASTIGGVLAHPRCPDALDLPAIASQIACLWAEGIDTSYRAVKMVPAGQTLVWTPSRGARLQAHWSVPEIERASPAPFDEAALELRALLATAAHERLGADAPTAVWLSGGWDSSAVFGAACHASGGAARVRPVSISYPEGDPGREDELIALTAAHWRADVHWLDIAGIPLLADPASEAAVRDEPFAHMYEHWNRALARGARAAGARVALDGNGGDQFHQVSPVYFADLLLRGRWPELARDARLRGVRGWRALARWAVLPALPPAALSLAGALRGRPVRAPFERPIPDWFGTSVVPREALAERERRTRTHPPRALGAAARETYFFAASGVFPRSFGMLAELALEEGVELRSPLYDSRVVAFVLGRPREDRASGAETKRLLRASMRGLLPDEVLAPRARRTGVTSAYSDRSIRRESARLFDEAFRAPIAAELGLVDAARLRAAWERHQRTGGAAERAPLFMTLQLELWLRARHRCALPQPSWSFETASAVA